MVFLLRNYRLNTNILIGVLSLFILNNLNAQLQVANWYFGNKAGLNFNVPNGQMPEVLFDGKLKTVEGCATISDNDGNLLFYTDGIKVFNANHQLMNPGNLLYGNPSSSQSGIIVPNPADNGLFYIFTVDANDNFTPSSQGLLGFRYSTVNMSLNGGLGQVTSFNNLLPLEAANPNLCSEKVTAVRHFNQHDIWVITHLRDKFYAFLVTDSGVSSSPVVTSIAPNVNPNGFVVNARGYIKASPNGHFLAIAHYSNLPQPLTNAPSNSSFPNNSISGNSTAGILGLYDFDSNTGMLSNYTELDGNGTPYGIEFSPNSKYLYAELDYFNNSGTEQATWSRGKLRQWDLSTLNVIDIVNINNNTIGVETNWPKVSNSTSGFFTRMRGALQLGIDGRIYYAKTHYYSNYINDGRNAYRGPDLSVINQPNLEGVACDFQVNSLQMTIPGGANPANDTNGTNHYVCYGLPPFITSYFNNEVDINVESVCEGEEAVFTLSIDPSVENITQIVWDMGDGTQYFDQESITHIYSSAGNYVVNVELHIGSDGLIIPVSVDLDVYPKPEVQNASLVQCDGATIDGKAKFDLTLVNDDIIINTNGSFYTVEYYLTQDDAENAINPLPIPYTNISNPQIVYARIENDYGCFRTAELELSVVNELFDLQSWEVCDDSSNDGKAVFNLTDLEDDIYSNVSGTNYAFYHTQQDSELDQNRINNFSAYTNLSNPEYLYIRVFNGDDCTGLGRIQLVVQEQPVILSSFQDVEFCDGGEVVLDPGDFDEYLWSDGSTNPTLTVTESGTYTVQVWNHYTNISCTASGSVTVTVHGLPELNPFDYVECEDNVIDGFTSFELSNANAEIVQNANGNSYTVEYYLNQPDAEIQQSQLPNDYINISNPQTIVARVENNFGCVSYAEVTLSVIHEEFQWPNPLYMCDDESNDGVADFNLTIIDQNIIDTYGGNSVSYYINETDAINGENEIINPGNFPNQTNPQTIYIRVWDGINCQALGEVQINVDQSPVLEIDDAKICPESSYTFDAGPGFTEYLWSTGNTSQSITVSEEGTYSVTVWNEAGCSTTEEMELIIVQPIITDIIVNGNQVEIIATGEHPLEYSLDLENWQSSNLFTGLPFGTFAAHVRDAYGCVSEAMVFSIITLPNIITPDGDGYNDQWNVKGLDVYPGTLIEIYDRYGKKIHENVVPQIYSSGTPVEIILNDPTPYYAWDGKYLGRAVPSTSYWYVIHIPDGRKLTGYLVVKNRESIN